MNPMALWKFTEKVRLAVNNLGEGYLVFTPACVLGVTLYTVYQSVLATGPILARINFSFLLLI